MKPQSVLPSAGRGCPPLYDVPFRPSRMIHFFDPSNERMAAKVPDIAAQVDVLLGKLEDAIPADKKAARDLALSRSHSQRTSAVPNLWTRINSLDSPWVLDDSVDPRSRNRRETRRDHGSQRLRAPRTSITSIACSHSSRPKPELPGRSWFMRFWGDGGRSRERRGDRWCQPADASASRLARRPRRKPPHEDHAGWRGHPWLPVRTDPTGDDIFGDRATAQQDLWHYTIARMVDACARTTSCRTTGRSVTSPTSSPVKTSSANAFLLGCVGTWTLHPKQIEIARRVFSPDVADVEWANESLRQWAMAREPRCSTARCRTTRPTSSARWFLTCTGTRGS